MKNFMRPTFSLSVCSLLLVAALASAAASLPASKPIKVTASLKKASPKAAPPALRPTRTTMNSAEVVIPNKDSMPLAQGQEATAAAKAGQKALEAGDLCDAEAEFSRSVALDNSDPDALVGLAQTLEQEGKGSQAIPVYRYLLYPKKNWGTSMEQDPLLRMRFALLLADDHQWPEAVSVYESVINKVRLGAMYPGLDVHFSPEIVEPALFQAMVHLAIGVTYDSRSEDAKALAEYQAAVSAQPNLALAHYYEGCGLQALRRRPEARAAFAKAAALGDGDVKKAAQSPNGLLPQ